MKTGFRGTFVISWSQTEVDGLEAAPVKNLSVGAAWSWRGDAVQVDGEYIRILGRRSEVINVGGEKVYPIEVESVIQAMDEVEDVVVRGESNPITGQIVVALVKTREPQDLKEFRSRLWKFCGDRLPRFKVPQKVSLVERGMHGPRFKKMR